MHVVHIHRIMKVSAEAKTHGLFTRINRITLAQTFTSKARSRVTMVNVPVVRDVMAIVRVAPVNAMRAVAALVWSSRFFLNLIRSSLYIENYCSPLIRPTSAQALIPFGYRLK
ncbi:hypothetical protein [Chitinophaga sp.]|uniref:hypothetical protein n=1 Tax=Chitinophaga sp. TaxID=1869181 RepID=UPI0031DCBCE7